MSSITPQPMVLRVVAFPTTTNLHLLNPSPRRANITCIPSLQSLQSVQSLRMGQNGQNGSSARSSIISNQAVGPMIISNVNVINHHSLGY